MADIFATLVVSRAFQVLSDPDKKTKYDKFGQDPDSRFANASAAASGGGASPFSGFRSPGGRGPMFEEELSPEELFRQFFGGGMGGGMGGPFGNYHSALYFLTRLTTTLGLDTGPGFVFNLGGGPGIRVQQFGGGRPRRRPNQAGEPESSSSILTSLLPLILLFVLPLLSSMFSASTPAGPTMRFDAGVDPHTKNFVSKHLKVPYWVNPDEVQDYSKTQLRNLDQMAEKKYIHHLNVQCDIEKNTQVQMMNDAQGWFFQDTDMMNRARRMDLKNCKKLSEMTRKSATFL
jgi:DnaJ family protein B protein 12